MTNVVRFPHGRSRPPPAPSADDLVRELTAAEIELVCARLAQIRSETRQASAFWAWYCFKRVLLLGFLLWLLATLAGAAQAQQTTFRDSRGSTIGTATRDSQGTTVFRDARGRTTGTASRDSGGTTTFRDAGGRTIGRSSR